jgi:UDP-N-acetylmuramate--alanine ligase
MQKIHLVGIGGAGMSGLAKILYLKGYNISGSDLRKNSFTELLKELPIRVFQGHDPSNLPEGCGLIIRSAAVSENNPEIEAAKSRNIEVIKYSQMVGRLTHEKLGIAIAGSHGKTTTVAMISYILAKAGLEPSFLCGGIIPQLEGNANYTKGKSFVVEACEYDRSFLNLSPKAVVITNIEEDHLDYYRDLDEIADTFKEFASLVGDDGIVVGNLDNPISKEITRGLKKQGECYSLLQDAEWRARSIKERDGLSFFEVLKYGKVFGEFTLRLAGLHNLSNALAAIAIANWMGVGVELIQLALSEFSGIQRRFELLGERDGVLVIDDYAHHPTEIRSTLKTARELFPERKIWCVFQPHQHSRTRIFLKEFSKAFADADVVILPEIFSARDDQEDIKRTSSAEIAELLDKAGKAALYLPSFDEIVDFLLRKITPGSVLLTLGAGDVDKIAKRFLNAC